MSEEKNTVAKEGKNCQRKRVKTSLYQAVSETKPSYDWSYGEKFKLLQALKKFGHLDLKNLGKAVPTKSKEQIKMFIIMHLKTARNTVHNTQYLGKLRLNIMATKPIEKKTKLHPRFKVDDDLRPQKKFPLEMWLQKLEAAQPGNNYNEIKKLPIARAFLYISKFEKHPDPTQCNGVDFRALYEFLYHMLLGYPAKALSPPTAKLVLESLHELSFNVKNQGKEEEIEFLDRVRRVSYTDAGEVRQYKGPNSIADTSMLTPSQSETCMRRLMKIHGFNPLKVPLNMLKKQQSL